MIGALNRAAGCPPTDDTCRQRIGRGGLLAGTAAISIPHLGPATPRF
ncbi:MAG: hypothetical protein AB8B83_02580 [Bdellovibrionales bacterium]